MEAMGVTCGMSLFACVALFCLERYRFPETWPGCADVLSTCTFGGSLKFGRSENWLLLGADHGFEEAHNQSPRTMMHNLSGHFSLIYHCIEIGLAILMIFKIGTR